MASPDNRPPADLPTDPQARRQTLLHAELWPGYMQVGVDHAPGVIPLAVVPADRYDEGTLDLLGRAVGWHMARLDELAREGDPPGGRGPSSL